MDNQYLSSWSLAVLCVTDEAADTVIGSAPLLLPGTFIPQLPGWQEAEQVVGRLCGCVGRGGRQVWWLLAWPALQEIWDDGAQASGCDKPVLPAGGHQDQPPAIPHELFWATAEWWPDWILKPCPQTLRAPASCRLQLSPGLSVRASSSPTSRTFHQGSLGGLIAVQSCIPLKIGAYFKCFSLNQ